MLLNIEVKDFSIKIDRAVCYIALETLYYSYTNNNGLWLPISDTMYFLFYFIEIHAPSIKFNV